MSLQLTATDSQWLCRTVRRRRVSACALRWQSPPKSSTATHLKVEFALAAISVIELSCPMAPLKPTSAKVINLAIIKMEGAVDSVLEARVDLSECYDLWTDDDSCSVRDVQTGR